MRKLNSLTARYILIVLLAIIMLPVAMLASGVLYISPWYKKQDEPYYPSYEVVDAWHKESKKMTPDDVQSVKKAFSKVEKSYKSQQSGMQ
jgi:hypothetical protein